MKNLMQTIMMSFFQKEDLQNVDFSKPNEFFSGIRDVIPFMVSAFPSGIIFGALALSNGLTFLESLVMSGLVYSGSAQFVGLGLIKLGANWPVIILTTLILSLRLLIYSALLIQYIKDLPHKWRLFLAFGLIDAVFFVMIERYKKEDNSKYRAWYFLGAVVALYINWLVSTLVGLGIGKMIPNISNLGFDFANIAVFMAMIVSSLINWKVWVTVITSGILILLTNSMPYNLGIIISGVGGTLVGVTCEFMYSSIQKKQNRGKVNG